MVGKIDPALFPAVFGPNGDMPLDAAVVRARFDALAQTVAAATGRQRTPEEVAEGFLKIAVDNMAHAIKHISVERGYDVTEYTLCCFGGAGGQHACAVADALGMTRVFIHPLAGVLSAYGMGLADVRALRQHAVEAVLDPAALATAGPLFARLADAARGEVEAQGIDPTMIELRARCTSNTTAPIRRSRSRMCCRLTRNRTLTVADIGTAFERRYSAQYGF
jgi:5-oxoprolinase (ATP-hydrolysing)